MTTDQKQLAAILVAALFLVLLISTWFWGFERGKRHVHVVVERIDTVWRTDTHFIDRPVEVVRWKEKNRPVYIAVHDTTRIGDTTYVVLPVEVKQYSGEDYEAQVSGIQPSLDWVKTYPKTAYITNTVVDKRRWGFGIAAGPGLLYDGQMHGGIGVVAGLQYNF